MTFNYKKIITAILLVAISQPVYPGWFSLNSVQTGLSRLVGQAKESPVLTTACVAGAVAVGYYGWQWHKQRSKNIAQEHNGITPETEALIIAGLQGFQKKIQQGPAQEHAATRIQLSSGSNSPENNSPATTKYDAFSLQECDIPREESKDKPIPLSPESIRKALHELDAQATQELPDFSGTISSPDSSSSDEALVGTRIPAQESFSPEQKIQNTLEKSERIKKGNTVLKALINGEYKSPEQGHEPKYLEDIINVIWALYGLADKKDQAFEQGTFVLEDKDFKIFKFLIEYAKRCNEYIKGTTEDQPSVPASTNPFAYCRKSSHYKNQQKNNKQYGIDIRCPETANALPILPAQKCHVLFGKIDEEKNLIFIKPEDHGIYYPEVHNHGIEYLKSQVRKLFPNGYFGSDDAPKCRRERVPKELIDTARKHFENLFGQNTDLSNNLLEKVKADGFKILFDMRDNAEKHISGFKDSFIFAINIMIEYFQQKYDNLELRRGREVIIRAKDLATFSPEDCEPREFHASTFEENSGWKFVEQSPEDILTSAQECLENLTKKQLQAEQEEITRHCTNLDHAREEVFLLLTRTSEKFVSEVSETMEENLKKCNEQLDVPRKIYPYLYGDNHEDGYDKSYVTVQEDVNNKMQTATEQEKVDLRQVEYLFHNTTSKEHFDAYLKGESALKDLMRADSDQEEFYDLLEAIGNCKDKLNQYLKKFKK